MRWAETTIPAIPAAAAPLRSEATSPERRRVLLAVLVINTVFLAVDVATYGAGSAVLAGRLLVSTALLLAWWVTGRDLPAATLRRWLVVVGALVPAGLGILAAGTGGAASPYSLFVPLVSMLLAIAVPDEPLPPLAAGGVALLAGLLVQPAGTPASHVAFLVAANVSGTFYGWVSAFLYRRMRERERAAAQAREQALADLHRSEDRRALSERLASLGRLAAGVAHEINNPLAFVGTNLAFVEESLAARPDVDPELREALVDSRGGLDRIKRIVQQLRGFARGSADGPGPTDAVAALGEARLILGARLARVARFEVKAAPDLPLVLAHRAELVQVLVNLLANAADALEQVAPERGPGRLELSLAPVEGGLEIQVADDGPGLTPEALRHVFEPFFSTKGPNGTGLGLALSREYVERWGGHIDAGNRPEGGARVVVGLRRASGMDGPGRGGSEPAGALPPRGR